MTPDPILRLENLKKHFPIKGGILDVLAKKPQRRVIAVDGVSLDIAKGESLGLVGESGCGKSTLAKTLVGIYPPDEGRILLEGRDIAHTPRKERRKEARNIQVIFQDPYSSLNPRMTVRDTLMEALRFHGMRVAGDLDARVRELLALVGLNDYQAQRFPGEFSGGQRQRIGIARVLALEPKIIIADEPVSALDVSIQAQVINLLVSLRRNLGLTMVFISHDLRVVKYVSTRIAVMYLGKIVELSDTESLFHHPAHPYTDTLLRAAPGISAVKKYEKELITGELPSPIDLPSGCRFHPRCPKASALCAAQEPPLTEFAPGRYCACHLTQNMQDTSRA